MHNNNLTVKIERAISELRRGGKLIVSDINTGTCVLLVASELIENETIEELRKAMATNPYLKVLNQSGYYDGATTYFAAKYTLSQIDPSGKMKDRMIFKGYRSGHMMYLRNEDLIKANEDLRVFIKKSSNIGEPAKY